MCWRLRRPGGNGGRIWELAQQPGVFGQSLLHTFANAHIRQCHPLNLVFDLVFVVPGLYWVANGGNPTLTTWDKGELSGSENQGRQDTPNYRKDKDVGMASKQPKARAPSCLILLVAATLCGLPASQVQRSFEETFWLCFIQVPNPDPSPVATGSKVSMIQLLSPLTLLTVASGLGSHEDVAFPMVDKWFSGRHRYPRKEKQGILITLLLTNNCPQKVQWPQYNISCLSFLHEVLSRAQVSVVDSFSVLLGLKLTKVQPSSACGFEVPLEGWKGTRPWRDIMWKVMVLKRRLGLEVVHVTHVPLATA